MNRRHLAFCAVWLATMAAVLASMGRPWWCKAGDRALWSIDIWSRHNSQHLVDPYSITHVLHGVLFYYLLWLVLRRFASPLARGVIALGIETTWEIVENTSVIIERYRAATISLDYYGDSVANSLGDVVSFALGFLAAIVLPWWVSLVGFVVADSLLVIWIRDGLVLNVIMLIHPIEAVKAWQLGAIQRP